MLKKIHYKPFYTETHYFLNSNFNFINIKQNICLGEKPFRCLYKPCLKRFRYKGDLSKHIKRYHPGHVQVI